MTTDLIAQLEEYAERKLSEAWSCMDGGADLCIGAALAADAADALSELQAENQRLREALDPDNLAQIIRAVDGGNRLGAGALAEAISAALVITEIDNE